MKMFREELSKTLWNYLHTITIANENAPNEPHRQVIFKEEIPEIISAIANLVKEIASEEIVDMEYVGFCTECRFKIKSFEKLIKCPNCDTTTVPCSIENNVKIKINWHELSILCMWAERWGMRIQQPGIIYGISHAIEKQYPDKGALTLVDQVNEVKKEFPDTKLYDGEGKEIQT